MNGSAAVNSTQLVSIKDGTSFVPVGDWQSHLAPHYKPLPGIMSQHHFRFDDAHSGMVFYKDNSCFHVTVTVINLMK